jgi:hypothetical protein
VEDRRNEDCYAVRFPDVIEALEEKNTAESKMTATWCRLQPMLVTAGQMIFAKDWCEDIF